MSTTFPHFQDTLYSGICAVNIPAPKMSPWQQSPAQHPPGLLWGGEGSAACTVCSVTRGIPDQQWADRTAQELMWAPNGEVEGAPFLEVEREEAEEPAVQSWLTQVWAESCCHDHCFTSVVLCKSSSLCCFLENISEVSKRDSPSSSRAGQ